MPSITARHACAVAIAATAALGPAAGTASAATPSSSTARSVTTTAAPDIRDRLEALPGMTVVKETPGEGYRYFELRYAQQVDHDNRRKGTFAQRVFVLHRDQTRPTVLFSTGYTAYGVPFRSEPATLVDGNQVEIEHRFYGTSIPKKPDWESQLTIEQAADDYHAVVSLLKGVYDQKWLSTGASKGGMTSVYHRRFHPDDVDGTIADVAPNDVDNDEDSAYDRHFEQVGNSQACQRQVVALEREMLSRPGVLAEARAYATRENLRYGTYFDSVRDELYYRLLGSDGLGYYLWQYGTEESCDDLPATDSSSTKLFEFLRDRQGFGGDADFEANQAFVAYYYQAAAQLGYPQLQHQDLQDLVDPDDVPVAPDLIGDLARPSFENGAMAGIDTWVREQGSELMFVYGENDPWSAEPFRLGNGTEDSYRYTVDAGNHGASFTELATAERNEAEATIRRWAGLPATQLSSGKAGAPTTIEGVDDRPDPMPGVRPLGAR
ncbi:MAG: S28 family serine protease [Dermatophilaceae bacterium]